MKKITAKRASEFMSRNVIVLLAGAAIALALGIAVASADTKSFSKARPNTAATELHITNSDQVLIRGAKVTSVSGTTIGATLMLGSTTVPFIVQTTSSTQFVTGSGSGSALADINVGDTINASGRLNMAASTLTINARVVKEISRALAGTITLSGTVQSVSTSTQTFVVQTASGTTTVAVSSSTMIRVDDDESTFAELSAGDRVHVIGALNAIHVVVAEKLVIGDDRDEGKGNENKNKDKNKDGFRGLFKSFLNGNLIKLGN